MPASKPRSRMNPAMVVPAMMAVRLPVPLEPEEDEVERAVGIRVVIWTSRCGYGWKIDLTGTYGGRNTIHNGRHCGKGV